MLLIDDAFMTADDLNLLNILAESGNYKIVIYTGSNNSGYLKKFAGCSSVSLFHKRSPRKDLIKALQTTNVGGIYADKKINNLINRNKIIEEIQDDNFYKFLTKREKEIMSLIKEGFENKAIADKLNITTKTVENHKEKIRQKSGIKTIKELYK